MMGLPDRREPDVRRIGTCTFRDSQPERRVESPDRLPEWVRRAKANQLPVKRFLP